MEDDSESLTREAAALTEAIYEAFRGVSRVGGISWADSEVVDNYGQPAIGKPIYHDRDRRWEDLVDDPAWVTCPGVGGYAFVDAIGFRYYLPPAMIRSIRQGYDDDIQFWLTLHDRNCEYTLDKWSLIDESQREVIVRFLIYMAAVSRESDSDHEADGWRAALENYWANALTPSPPRKARAKRPKKAPPRSVW